jgi:phytanoyl-CoA hydroxylase
MTTAMPTLAGSVLSARDVEFYKEHGYVVVESVLDADILGRARASLAEFVEGARGLTESNAKYDLEPTHRPDAPRVRRMKQPHRLYPVFDEIARLPKVITALTQLLGPSVRFKYSKLNLKDPFGGSPIEWHQDWAFYPHTNDDLLAMGVMLEDCNDENGPLLVVPGSHRGPIYDHHSEGVFCGAIDPKNLGDAFKKAVPMKGPAGSMTFHHVRLLHGSAENRSKYPRPLLLYGFNAGDAWPLEGSSDTEAFNFEKFDSELVAGKPTIVPRIADVPIRMPLPLPPKNGSIYDRQAAAVNKFFDVKATNEG